MIGLFLVRDVDVLFFGILIAMFPFRVTPSAKSTLDFSIAVKGPGNNFSIMPFCFLLVMQYSEIKFTLFTKMLTPFSFLPFILILIFYSNVTKLIIIALIN